MNSKALEQFRGVGGSELVRELIDLFLAEAPLRIEAARRGLQASDASAIKQAIHSLASTSGQLGALAMEALCEKARLLIEEKKLEMIPTLLDRVEEEFVKVKAWLEIEASRM